MKIFVILLIFCATSSAGAETLKEWRTRENAACPPKFVQMDSDRKERAKCINLFEAENPEPYDRKETAAEISRMNNQIQSQNDQIRSQEAEMQIQQAEMRHQEIELEQKKNEMQRIRQQQEQQKINNMFRNY